MAQSTQVLPHASAQSLSTSKMRDAQPASQHIVLGQSVAELIMGKLEREMQISRSTRGRSLGADLCHLSVDSKSS